ncbi:MAG TPA: YicC family protein [Clostridiales bacterium]|nr:YicC family protein [Clostridiales bacterium]
MIKSMTGFGRGEYKDEKREIVAEIRTVNHRYSDIMIKMPRRYGFAEEKIKNLVKQTVKRGKTEVSLQIEMIGESDQTVRLNPAAARQYYENLTELKQMFQLEDAISLQLMAGLPDVLRPTADLEDEEAICTSFLTAVTRAVERLDEMRRLEGGKLAADILERADLIADRLTRVEVISPQVVVEYQQRLKERMQELLGGQAEIPEERILVEAALFADKYNITEEIVRLGSHIVQLRRIIGDGREPAGKKLDFLIQEMNREVNTIGSKGNDLEITNIVLVMKSEIEKIREQVQNIE